MSKHTKDQILIQNILDKIGGINNIKDVYHCATRMRLTLFDDRQANVNEIKTITNIKGALFSNGELQIIIGQEVPRVTSLLKEYIKEKENDKNSPNFNIDLNRPKQKVAMGKRFLKSVSAIFGPLIPFLIGVGLIMAVQQLLIRSHAVNEIKDGGILGINYNIFDYILNVIASTGFKLMGVIAIWSTVRYIGGNSTLAIALGLIMVSPVIPDSGVELGKIGDWNITLKPFYSTILVFIVMGIVVAYTNIIMSKYLNPVANFILNPLCTLLVGGLLAFFVMGPIMGIIENALLTAFNWFMTMPFGIGTFIVGITWQPLVVLGVHNILFFAAVTDLTTNNNPSLFLAAAFAAAWAQMGATIAVGLKNKKMIDKSAAFIAATPGIISGPTESCIYAVNLPRVLPFITGTIAGGIGGWLIGMFNVTLDNLAGLGGIVGFLAYTDDLLPAILIDLGSFALGIAITYFLFSEYKTEKKLSKKTLKEFNRIEMLTTKLDFVAYGAIKLIKKQKLQFWHKKKINDELVQYFNENLGEFEKLKPELVEITKEYIKNKNEGHSTSLKEMCNILGTIHSDRQKQINENYIKLKTQIDSLKEVTQTTKKFSKLLDKKANFEFTIKKISEVQEENGAKLFDKGQILIHKKDDVKIAKGQKLILASEVFTYKKNKLEKTLNKKEEIIKLIDIDFEDINNLLGMNYDKIQNIIVDIEKNKNKDLNLFKNKYHDNIFELLIQEGLVQPKMVFN